MPKRQKHKFPLRAADCADVPSAIRNFILPGFVPPQPFMTKDMEVITAGSCFAQNLAVALQKRNVKATHIWHQEGTNTPPSTDAIIELCVKRAPGLEEAHDVLRRANMFIITLGVALAPFVDGRPVLGKYEMRGGTITFKMLTPQEIATYTVSTIERARTVNPNISIVLTVSPLPLHSAFGEKSVFAQDCLSKSSLRVGTEFVLASGLPKLHYWPSFEMVRWLSPHVAPVFDVGDAQDNRHLSSDLTDLITGLFIESYFDLPKEPAAAEM